MNTCTPLERLEAQLFDLYVGGTLSESSKALVNVAWVSINNARQLEEAEDQRSSTYLEYFKSIKPTTYPTNDAEPQS